MIPPDALTEGHTVLIVEDDEDSRYVYTVILEEHGFRVISARTGDDGVRLAREEKPDVILMDVSIPGIDGWSATRALKAGADTGTIPVVIITAHAFAEDRRRAELVRCDGFLTKPCEPRTVLDTVRGLIGA